MTVCLLFSDKMAVKMVPFLFFLVLSVIGANAAGEFSVLYSPDTLQFPGNIEVRETTLKEIFSASLGLSTSQHENEDNWEVLYIRNPFELPEAAVEIYVDGVQSLDNFDDKAKTYPMIVDEYEPDTYGSISRRINLMLRGEGKLVNMMLSDEDNLQKYSSIFGKLSVPKLKKQQAHLHLKYTVEEDAQFLMELETLKAITAAVKNLKPDNKIDFFHFRFSSLHPLSDFHGPNSLATKEAKRLLSEQIMSLEEAFRAAYDGRVVIAAVTTDVAHTRRTVRDVSAQATMTVSDEMDDGDYPAIFNIILWFSVVMIFTLVAIVYSLVDMDPGRDSIIYRMTSTRMKKDN